MIITIASFIRDCNNIRITYKYKTNEIRDNLVQYLHTYFLHDVRYKLEPTRWDITILQNTYKIPLTRTIFDRRNIILKNGRIRFLENPSLLYRADRELLVVKPSNLFMTLNEILIENGILKEDATYNIVGQISPIDINADDPTIEAYLNSIPRLYRLCLFGTINQLLTNKAIRDTMLLDTYESVKYEAHAFFDNPNLIVNREF